MTTTIEEYIEKSQVDVNKFYSSEEAVKIINDNVIALYKGRISLKDNDDMSGMEIAEKLHIIHAHFDKSFNEAWNKEFPDDQI